MSQDTKKGLKSGGVGEEAFAAFIGIDWADEKHDVHLYDVASGASEASVLRHTPENLAEWATQLGHRYAGRRVAICLEQTRGALVYALMRYEHLVLFPINPVTAARYREAFAPSGSKNDPADAQLLCELVRMHRDKLRTWKPEEAATRELQLLCEDRRKLVDMRTNILQRVKAVLKGYFPQAITWAGVNLTHPLASDFLLKWPSLADVQKAREQTVRKFYWAHCVRLPQVVDQRLKEIREAQPLTTDTVIVEASRLSVLLLMKQVRQLNQSVKGYDARIAVMFTQHPDHDIFASFPAAGAALAPRLLVAFGADRERFADCGELQTHSGIAPVIERSGKQVWTHWRWACPTFLRQTFQEYARNSVVFCGWARVCYERMLERGMSPQSAFRALAFKWQRIMFRCWKDRTPYDEDRYLKAMQRQESPVVKALMAVPAKT